jgi:hypothetical protein
MVEPVYLMNGNTTSNVTVQSLLPAGDEVALPSLPVAMASGALDASSAVGVEPSTFKSEPGTSSDERLQYTISDALDGGDSVPATVMTTETTMPVANKGQKHKGRGQGPTLKTNTTRQGTWMKKDITASPREELATGELPLKKHKAALPREESMTGDLPLKKHKMEEVPSVRTSAR